MGKQESAVVKSKLPILLLAAIVLLLLFSSMSCKKNPVTPLTGSIVTLAVEDISSTGAWLRIKAENQVELSSLKLFVNGAEQLEFSMKRSDTLVYIEKLQVKKQYTFLVAGSYLNEDNEKKPIPETKQIAETMDTTNHNYFWQTFKFGYENGSVLFDVSIIDKNDIWAVGAIYLKDSLGNHDPHAYNAIHWDGVQWKVLRILYEYNGSFSLQPIKTVYAFSSKDVWYAGNGVINWNGTKFLPIDMPRSVWGPYWINKIWGTSSQDIYVVGDHGSIAHYDGKVWEKIATGTDVNLLDVYGDKEGKNVWVCGYTINKTTVLFKIVGKKLETVINSDEELYTNFGHKISGTINSVWTNDSKKMFALTWHDLFRARADTKGEGEAIWAKYIDGWADSRVRDNNVNDLTVVGFNGRIWHFNGATWKLFDELVNRQDDLRGLEVKGDIVVAVGDRYINGIENYGLIHIGHRYPK